MITINTTILPVELVDLILQYDGRIKYRCGKFMTQLQKNPTFEKLLNESPKKYEYFSGKHPCYWNAIVEFYILTESTEYEPLRAKKFIMEYNNYSSTFDSVGTMKQSSITYIFLCKNSISEMNCIHITS